MKDNEYQCYICKGIFEKGQSDEEAVKELDSVFPLFTPDESELVCDDCYHDILKVKDTSSNNEKKKMKFVLTVLMDLLVWAAKEIYYHVMFVVEWASDHPFRE